MKKSILLIALLGILWSATAGDGVRFVDYKKKSFKEVLAQAQAENKPVFVDIWTVWCGPCKWLKAHVLNRKDVGDFYNKNFINLEFDAEDPDWVEIAEKYYATAFPTLLFLTPEGEVLFEAHNIPITAMNDQGEPVAAGRMIEEGEIALKYWKMSEKDYFTKENWSTTKERATSLNSNLLGQMLKQRKELEAIYGEEVSRRARHVLGQHSVNIFRKASGGSVLNQEKYDRIKELAAYLEPKDAAEVILNMDLGIAMHANDPKKAVRLIEDADKQKVVNPLNKAWYAAEFLECDDRGIRDKAKKWVEEAIREAPQDARYLPQLKSLLEEFEQ